MSLLRENVFPPFSGTLYIPLIFQNPSISYESLPHGWAEQEPLRTAPNIPCMIREAHHHQTNAYLHFWPASFSSLFNCIFDSNQLSRLHRFQHAARSRPTRQRGRSLAPMCWSQLGRYQQALLGRIAAMRNHILVESVNHRHRALGLSGGPPECPRSSYHVEGSISRIYFRNLDPTLRKYSQ